MLTPPSLCLSCQHLTNRETFNDDREFFCSAYPEGIPWRFISGGDHHTSPADDQSGDLYWEPWPGSDVDIDAFIGYWWSPSGSEYNSADGEVNADAVIDRPGDG